MLEGGFVVGVMDSEYALGFAPVATPSMRLVDRVTSLFIADFLTRPADYARFRICDACSAIMFDGGAEHFEVCLKPARISETRITGAGAAHESGEGRRTSIGLDGCAA